MGTLEVFAVADLVDNPAELGDHMEEVEDNFAVGDFLADGFEKQLAAVIEPTANSPQVSPWGRKTLGRYFSINIDLDSWNLVLEKSKE